MMNKVSERETANETNNEECGSAFKSRNNTCFFTKRKRFAN